MPLGPFLTPLNRIALATTLNNLCCTQQPLLAPTPFALPFPACRADSRICGGCGGRGHGVAPRTTSRSVQSIVTFFRPSRPIPARWFQVGSPRTFTALSFTSRHRKTRLHHPSGRVSRRVLAFAHLLREFDQFRDDLRRFDGPVLVLRMVVSSISAKERDWTRYFLRADS